MNSPQTCRSNALRRAWRGILCIGLSTTFVVAGVHGTQNAVANGDTRSLLMHHTHTGETINITFKRDGRYDEAALNQLNRFLRDWRNDAQIRMDPHLFDLVWEVYREVGGKQPIQIISAYRSPATNAMLHSRSRGVAEHSQHMLGKAMDFFIPDANLSTIREAGLRLQRGGVGFYPTSGSPFVHLDTGSIRYWPRMSREQLARVFPDGKTVYLPADGRPLAGYEAAARAIAARGRNTPTSVAFAARNEPGDDVEMTNDGRILAKSGPRRDNAAPAAPARRSLFAWMRDKDDEAPARAAPASTVAVAYAPAEEPRAARPPAAALALASVSSTPVKPDAPVAAPEPQMRWVAGPSGQNAEAADTAPMPRARPAVLRQPTQVAAAEMTASIVRAAPAMAREADVPPPVFAAAQPDAPPVRMVRATPGVAREPASLLILPRIEGPGLPRLITANRFGAMPVDLRHPDARTATPLLHGNRDIVELSLDELPVRRGFHRVADAAALIDAGRRGARTMR